MTEEAFSTLGTMILKSGLVLGEMYEPSTPGSTADVKDTSSQNNVGGVRTKLVSWIDNENLAFKLYYTGSTAQETLIADIYDRHSDTWQVVLPPTFHAGGHSFSWTGQIAKCKKVTDGEGPAYIEMEVTVSGKITPLTTLSTGLTTPWYTIAEENANALTPVPIAGETTVSYEIEAYSDNTWVKITPTASAGTIRVNGTVVATGVASGEITLNTGTGAITYISVTVSTVNTTPVIYWIRVRIGPTAHP